MVSNFSTISDTPLKEEAATPPKSSPMVALKLPTFKWGAARRLRRQLPDSGDNKSPARPSEVDDEAAMAPYAIKDASFESPRRLPHEGGGDGGAGGGGEERRKRNKEKMAEFRLPLSNREIDQDFFSMTGQRVPRRPKRRPKAVQNNVEVMITSFGLLSLCS